jgi:hypothetical protein
VGDQEEELSGEESVPLECVAFMLVTDSRVLAEKRTLTKSWEGEILNREAEALRWASLDESHALDLAIDRVAVGEDIRVHQNQHD